MHMIGDAVDDEWLLFHFHGNAPHVCHEPVLNFLVDGRMSVLGAENDMGEQVRKGVRHEALASVTLLVLSPLRGCRVSAAIFPRLTPWAIFFRPSGAVA